MIPTLDALERRLIDAYEAQSKKYDRAVSIIDNAAKDDRAGDAWIQDLHDVLREIAAGDNALASDQAAWRQTTRSPGEELRSILDRLTDQIRVLSDHVDSQLAELLARRQRLLPEIDAFSRQRQMLDAYGTHGQVGGAEK